MGGIGGMGGIAGQMAALFKRIVTICTGVLLLSGAYLAFDRLTTTTLGWPYLSVLALKILIALCMFALAIYLVVKIRNDVLRNPPGDKRPAEAAVWRRAKILAGLSLACWMAVIAAGRFLAYTHTWLRVGLPADF